MIEKTNSRSPAIITASATSDIAWTFDRYSTYTGRVDDVGGAVDGGVVGGGVVGGAAKLRPGNAMQNRSTDSATPRIQTLVTRLASSLSSPTRSIHSDRDGLRGVELSPGLCMSFSSRVRELGSEACPSSASSEPHGRDDGDDDAPSGGLFDHFTRGHADYLGAPAGAGDASRTSCPEAMIGFAT